MACNQIQNIFLPSIAIHHRICRIYRNSRMAPNCPENLCTWSVSAVPKEYWHYIVVWSYADVEFTSVTKLRIICWKSHFVIIKKLLMIKMMKTIKKDYFCKWNVQQRRCEFWLEEYQSLKMLFVSTGNKHIQIHIHIHIQQS